MGHVPPILGLVPIPKEVPIVEEVPLASDDSTKHPPEISSENVHVLEVVPSPPTEDKYPFP